MTALRWFLALAMCSTAVGQWEELADIATGALQDHGVARVAGAIYTVGGLNASFQTVATVNRYDVALGKWDAVSDLPAPVHHPILAAVGGKLYMLGGLVSLRLDQAGVAFVYDPSTDKWSKITAMGPKFDRGASGVAVVNSNIYVMGGLQKGKAVNLFSVYNTKTDKWDHKLPSMPGLPRDHLVGAAVNNGIFAIGGQDTHVSKVSSEVLMYDRSKNEWTRRSSMPTARAGSASAVLDGMVVVVGGEGSVQLESGVFPRVEVYDAQEDVWWDAGKMATPRHGMGAAAYNGSIYVPGGATVAMLSAVSIFDKFTPPARR
eukprot:evm.model.scf_171.12 EVM.evm.TU.scf_171.12   scf_171:115052-117821(+)